MLYSLIYMVHFTLFGSAKHYRGKEYRTSKIPFDSNSIWLVARNLHDVSGMYNLSLVWTIFNYLVIYMGHVQNWWVAVWWCGTCPSTMSRRGPFVLQVSYLIEEIRGAWEVDSIFSQLDSVITRVKKMETLGIVKAWSSHGLIEPICLYFTESQRRA